jgi:alpha-tubulin suppressor-like RCC1 family protein
MARTRAIVALGLTLAAPCGCKGRFALPADARFVLEIVVADGFALGRMKDGSIRGWGKNDRGQLGDGTTASRSESVRVGGAADGGPGAWTRVVSGGAHACAISAGELRCWGDNADGQLGDGTKQARSTPVAVIVLGGAHVKDVALGERHSCALTEDGSVICWGADDAGQLGRLGGAGPVDIHDATAIAAGGTASCATLRDHTVRCWGRVPPRRSPTSVTRVEGLADVVEVAMSSTHVCAVRAWGGVACWGSDDEGELGDGAFVSQIQPVDVQGLAVPALSVAVGRSHSCVLLKNATVYCWGGNAKNQLADGTQAHRPSPLLVNGLFEIQAITAAGDGTCARFSDGAARCWGGLALPKTQGDVMPVPTEVRW